MKLKQKEQNFMMCWMVWEKVFILVKSAFCVEILRSVIAYLQVCPTRMLRSVSPAWQCWAMQVCAPVRPSLSLDREHFHTPPQSWPHTIRFSPVVTLKGSLLRVQYKNGEAQQNAMHLLLQRKESSFYRVGVHAL